MLNATKPKFKNCVYENLVQTLHLQLFLLRYFEGCKDEGCLTVGRANCCMGQMCRMIDNHALNEAVYAQFSAV